MLRCAWTRTDFLIWKKIVHLETHPPNLSSLNCLILIHIYFYIKILGFFSSKAYSYFDAYQTDVPLSTTGNFLIVFSLYYYYEAVIHLRHWTESHQSYVIIVQNLIELSCSARLFGPFSPNSKISCTIVIKDDWTTYPCPPNTWIIFSIQHLNSK